MIQKKEAEVHMKMKLFSKQKPLGNKGTNQLDFQNEINDWLEKAPSIKVISIKQSACGGSMESPQLFISVWYEEVT
jgi:hypothetical protein